MYLLSILTVIVVMGLMVFLSQASIVFFLDIPSLLFLVVLLIPILISAGVLKDFNNAFRIVMEKDSKATIAQINRSITAVELAGKTLLAGSGFIAICALIIMLFKLDSPEQLGPNLAVAMLTLLYGLIGNLLLLPLKAKLTTRKIGMME